ncbi:MAG TPA: 3-oxoacyl-ACP reductase FabG [Chitinophagales bacterium]|nr:3-oxoacyl-ACP reductase FabG [Chitinophagales bacterium]
MNYALVTGGSRGIGSAICIKLAEMGFAILLNYKSNDEEANNTKQKIEALGIPCELLKFDVSNPEETTTVLTNWLDNNKTAKIEVLVNNAGIRQDNLIVFMPEEQWHSVINSNLNAFYYISKIVVKNMLAARYGRIINIVSLSGTKGMAGQTNYSAAKAGVIGATKALALEIAKRNITVNAVAPGFIATDMTKDLNEKELSEHIPMKRFGTPQEVADTVGFLASKSASYITGQVISINGGLST